MKMKSYFARDVKAALDLAREEMGPEAMLIQSRKAPPEARHLGEYEVVMALPILGKTRPAEGPKHAQAQQDYTRLSADMAEMRKQLERMAAAVTRSSAIASARELPQPGTGRGVFGAGGSRRSIRRWRTTSCSGSGMRTLKGWTRTARSRRISRRASTATRSWGAAGIPASQRWSGRAARARRRLW